MPVDCISHVSKEEPFQLEAWALHCTILAKNFTDGRKETLAPDPIPPAFI